MDKLIDHIYINMTAKGGKLIKLADPAQVKKIMYHNTIEVKDQRMNQTLTQGFNITMKSNGE